MIEVGPWGAYAVYSLTQTAPGRVIVREESNDDRDIGRPGPIVRNEYGPMRLADALHMIGGPTHMGSNGTMVTTFLDGVLLTAENLTEMAGREPSHSVSGDVVQDHVRPADALCSLGANNGTHSGRIPGDGVRYEACPVPGCPDHDSDTTVCNGCGGCLDRHCACDEDPHAIVGGGMNLWRRLAPPGSSPDEVFAALLAIGRFQLGLQPERFWEQPSFEGEDTAWPQGSRPGTADQAGG